MIDQSFSEKPIPTVPASEPFTRNVTMSAPTALRLLRILFQSAARDESESVRTLAR